MQLPKGKIGPNTTKKILPWVETFYARKGRYPTDLELAEHFKWDANDLLRLHSSTFYNNCLKSRGIRRDPKEYTEKQVAALALITNFSDKRSTEAKLASIGVTPEMYQGWLRDSSFKRELQSRADDVLDNVFPEAQVALAKKVKSGDVPALKFYYEITGRSNSPEVINVRLAVARVIEAIQKHVKDPAILQAIAAEINGPETVSVEAQPPVANTSVKELYLEARQSYEHFNA